MTSYVRGGLADSLARDICLDVVEMKEQFEYIRKNFPWNLEAPQDGTGGSVE